MTTDADVDPIDGGRNCPECSAPLVPEHLGDSLALAWTCPTHGPQDVTPDPLGFAD